MTEDPELARRMRAGLESRASEADTSAPVVSRARVAASRRRGCPPHDELKRQPSQPGAHRR